MTFETDSKRPYGISRNDRSFLGKRNNPDWGVGGIHSAMVDTRGFGPAS